MMSKIESNNSEDTEQFGNRLGSRLKGGEVIELESDLGGGKTTLVRGIARGAGSRDHVSSPSFVLSKLYHADGFDICHFDFYRLNDSRTMEQELAEVLENPTTVVVVEWADTLRHVLPSKRMAINIRKTGENSREFICSYDASLAYLLENLLEKR